MEAIFDVQSDIVSTIAFVGKFTTGNDQQRRTKEGYDFLQRSLEKTKLQCERGIQASRDGQTLAPSTIGKFTYYHRLFANYEEILIQEHDKLCERIEYAEVNTIKRTRPSNRALLTPSPRRKGAPYIHKEELNTSTPSYNSPQYSPTRTHITVSSSASASSDSSFGGSIRSNTIRLDDTSMVHGNL